jgi:hypothetical protein
MIERDIFSLVDFIYTEWVNYIIISCYAVHCNTHYYLLCSDILEKILPIYSLESTISNVIDTNYSGLTGYGQRIL